MRMKLLLGVTIGMAVLIVLGTTVLIVTVIRRASAPAAPGPPFARVLDQPAGTAIAGIAGAGGRLAVLLHGGGPDRVVLVDPATGRIAGRVGLGK
ncbi:MAG: hypothetical protein KGI51_03950 [Rhodospirillales bacterium]|nr:hypothetical protein [Rhodospirillales bacterium]